MKEWDLALPLHPEFRTLPMLFYVPPLLPVMASVTEADNSEQSKKINPAGKHWPDSWLYDTSTKELFGTIDDARFPLQYMANLFSAGDTAKVGDALKKLMAVRLFARQHGEKFAQVLELLSKSDPNRFVRMMAESYLPRGSSVRANRAVSQIENAQR